MNHRILAAMAFAISAVLAGARGPQGHDSMHVLSPITHGKLTIFPVVGGADYDTSRLLTLDEGVRTGAVVVTEQGSLQGLRRGRPTRVRQSAEVNQLVLINNSDRPLLLLAGEIVTGGKQDRVIGADRLVPPHSDPIALSVFCVEPGRWVGASNQFSSMKSQMAQPSVRVPAMAERDQHEVWNQVAVARDAVASMAGSVARGLGGTSYAKTMAVPQVQEKIDSVAGGYEGMLTQLRKAGAKGVVVAVNGNIVWADLFASNDLLARYWEKLVRSYATESLTSVSAKGEVDQKAAQAFLDKVSGSREVIETEPGVFRRTEITGDGYKVFTLTSLIGKSEFNVHSAKMAYDADERSQFQRGVMVR